jgi:hypothetical protein
MSSIGLATIINGPLVFGPTDMTAATSAATMGSRQTAVIFSMLWFWSVNMTNGIKRPQATNMATPPPRSARAMQSTGFPRAADLQRDGKLQSYGDGVRFDLMSTVLPVNQSFISDSAAACR